jgi:uncharacterized protein (DUF362 family)
MNDLSRRRFIRLVAASLGSLGGIYLAGCLNRDKLLGKSIAQEKTSPTAFLPDFTSTEIPSTATEQPTNTPENTPEPSPTVAYPDLVVARNGEPDEMVRKAITALGGIERFVKPGDKVVVKPNICVAYHGYQYAATTNPWVVGAIVKLAVDAGARIVKVMDYPFGGTAEQAYSVSGIQSEVKKAGGVMKVMSGLRYIDTPIPQGKDLKSIKIYEEVLKADVIINVPIAKHHQLARLTLAMKNMMGVIYDRPLLHANLGQRLADLNSRVRSNLVVVDAVRILMNHGPSGGNLADVRKADTIIASPDIVASDSYAATLFGLQPNDLSYIKKGKEMGLGVKNLDKLKIEEINLG